MRRCCDVLDQRRPDRVVGLATVATLNSSTGADSAGDGAADFLKSLALTTATGGGDTTVVANRATSAASVGSLIRTARP